MAFFKAITTTFHPASATRGPRITASDSDGNRNTIAYPDDVPMVQRHQVAATALCLKMNWGGELAEGYLDARRHVFVWVKQGGTDKNTLRIHKEA